MNDTLQKLKDKNIISEQQKKLIEEYNLRMKINDIVPIYNLRHLRKILKIRKNEQELFFGAKRNKNYRVFYIPKKISGYRKIEAPSSRLLDYQEWIKKNILEKFNVSIYAKGFKKNCSIIDNALPHVNKKVLINIDLKDFFSTIKYNKVFKLYIYMGYTKEVAHLLTKLCTNNLNVLPQGAPTSPILTNLLCLKLDKRLSLLAKSFNSDYTRYADDITFSGDNNILKMVPLIKKIILDEQLIINEKKFRIRFANQRQEVTGLIVNKKLSVSKNLIKEIKHSIYFCQKYGVDNHMKKIKCDRLFYKEHLYGIAYFIKMIDISQGNKFLFELDKINWVY